MNSSIKTYRGNGGIIIEIYDAERERRCTATMNGNLAVKNCGWPASCRFLCGLIDITREQGKHKGQTSESVCPLFVCRYRKCE